LNNGEADRPGPYDKHVDPRRQPRPVDCVSTDPEGFHEGQLIEGQCGGRKEFVHANADPFTHAAVAVNSEYLQGFAAIPPFPQADAAGPTIQVRLDRTMVADLHPRFPRGHCQYFDAEFVPEDAGVRKERLPAGERMQVGAADANLLHSDQGMSGQAGRLVRMAGGEPTGFVERDLQHEKSFVRVDGPT
jgi:hypothetical protein